MLVKVGEISFVNFVPFCTLAEYPTNCEILKTYPANLNDACRRGELDISPISFFAFNDVKDEYEILSNFTIASDGVVDSVKLYANCDIQDLKGKPIYFTKKSESSIAAFCAICKFRFGFNPKEFECENLNEAQAAFLIGDDVFEYESTFEKSWDLGLLWKETFKIPMVYAVIIAKKSLPNSIKKSFISHYEKSLENFYSNKEKFAEIASQKLDLAKGNFTKEHAKDYFNKLIFKSNISNIKKALEILNGKFD